MTEPADEFDAVDRRVAEHLARGGSGPHRASDPEFDETQNDDLFRRLNALDFVDAIVGGAGVPERIGDYRVTSLLGRGGMGTVYGAFQESLEREVALKVLAPSLSADPTMRRRFRVEARATAALHHQHIVPIYDFGEAGGLLFFTMEKIDGVSLDQHIARARREGRMLFSPREAARRFAGVADALAHAHRRRILHRDVKPANLLVHRDGTLALADFGLSRVLGEASIRSSGRGGFLGTLQYASPEQARSEHLTPASDLYSLGVTVYEAVSGQLPFRAETPEAVLDALLNQDPRNLRSVRPDVPPDLAAIVGKLLHKDAVDRYADGETLARDLRRVADGEPVYVRRQPLALRLWRRVRRRPGLAAAVAVAGLLGLTSIYAITMRAIDMSNNRLASYQSLIGEAIRTLADDPGQLSGPDDLLAVLAGVGHDVAPSAAVHAAIERARSLAPEQPGAGALRAAYEARGLPEAEAELLAGHGLRAKQMLDERIKQSLRDLATTQPLDQVRLYRLFLARAIACLTAPVGDVAQARADLQVASLFRPGAYAPRVLGALLELALSRDTETAVQDLEALARGGPPGGTRIVLELLGAMFGDVRPATSQAMRLPLARARRGRLLIAALERLAAGEVATDGVRWSGLEGELAEVAEQALRRGVGRTSDALRSARRRLAEEVDARAPLQSWNYVFELLQRGNAADRSLLAAELRPLACLDLLALDPARAVVAALRPMLESAADDADGAGDPGVAAELRARVRLILSPRSARPFVEAWVKQALDDPEAYMARLECCIAEGAFDDAKDAAIVAVQRAPHRDLLGRRVLDRLRIAASGDARRAAAWLQVHAQFEPWL
ncbi:MAG: serine/threonine-protein kinase [Planctomycetota bacterium]